MDVFNQLEGTMNEFYTPRVNTNIADHSLQSPDITTLASSPQSIFMYEHDSEPAPYSKPSMENNNTQGDKVNPLSNPLFEAPVCWPASSEDMMMNFGCDDLTDSFLSESSVCGSSLGGSSLCGSSFNDSFKDSVWDFAGYDDVSSPLQHPEDDLLHSPTLAELNMEDTHDVFASINQQQQQSAFATSSHTKTKPVLIKQSSHRPHARLHPRDKPASLRRKAQTSSAPRDHKYSSLFTVQAKSSPLLTNSMHQEHPRSQSLHNPIKIEPTCYDLTSPGAETLPSLTENVVSGDVTSGAISRTSPNCLSFSNLLGRRTRTFTSTSPIPQQTAPSYDDTKTVVKKESRVGGEAMEVVANIDESSVDRKWEEIKSFIDHDMATGGSQGGATTTVKKEALGGGGCGGEQRISAAGRVASSPTKLTFKRHAHGYTVKVNEMVKQITNPVVFGF